MSDTKQERCEALWHERPNSSAADIAALYKERHGEDCSVVTARKARPKGGEGNGAGPITAAELRRLKEIAQRNGGLTTLAKEVMLVAKLGEEFGGVARLAEAVQEFADLIGGKD
jgi:hypothetical protein